MPEANEIMFGPGLVIPFSSAFKYGYWYKRAVWVRRALAGIGLETSSVEFDWPPRG